MPIIASYDDVKTTRRRREIPGGYAWRTDFLNAPDGPKDAPMAFLSESTAGRVIRPHFHDKDQFQIIVSGGGTLGKHELALHAVHFTRAYTAYGPLVADRDGVGFISLYQRWDRGAHYLPESSDELRNTKGRQPWQITEQPKFGRSGNVNAHRFSQISNDDGLSVYSISLSPCAKTAAPGQPAKNGQYIVVTKGGLEFEGKKYEALTVAFVVPDEDPFPLLAGPQGAEALVLTYPRQLALD